MGGKKIRPLCYFTESQSQSSFESHKKRKDGILFTQIYFCSLHDNKAKYSVCASAFWQTRAFVYEDWPVKMYR